MEGIAKAVKDLDLATFFMLVKEARFISPEHKGDTVWFNFVLAMTPEEYDKLMQDYYADTGRALVSARQYSFALKSVRDILGMCRNRSKK